MSKRILRIAAACACILLVGIRLAGLVGGNGRQRRAERCFARNEAALAETAAQFDAGKRSGLDENALHGIDRVIVHADPDHLEFRTEAFGIAPSSVYSGFYYSPEDVPLGFEKNMHLVPDGDGWRWQGVGDNRGYTYRIKENWFYYEASF